MDKRLHRFFVIAAITLTLGWVGWAAYESFILKRFPGDHAYLEGDQLFEDAAYDRALAKYNDALKDNPKHLHAMRGKARTLLQLEQYGESLRQFNAVIALQPELGALYANRGILYDRMGEHEKAAIDYEKALSIDEKLADGPHWLTRFLRNQPEKPPGIKERAEYIRKELAKPESERLLHVPELDEKQRSFKQ